MDEPSAHFEGALGEAADDHDHTLDWRLWHGTLHAPAVAQVRAWLGVAGHSW